jgi:outer membrane protein TolC
MAYESFREEQINLYHEVSVQWYALCALQAKWHNQAAHRPLLVQLENLAVQRFAAGGSAAVAAASPSPDAGASKPAAPSMGGMNMSKTPLSGNAGRSAGGAPASGGSSMPMGGAAMPMNGAASGLAAVLRIQSERIELETQYENTFSEIQAATGRFNALLNRPATAEVVLPDSIEPLYLPVDTGSVSSAVAQHPMVVMWEAEARAFQSQEKMARKMGYPMFGIGLQYMIMNRRTETPAAHTSAAMSGMNGKNMLMPMVSLTLPIYRAKYRAAVKEAQLLQAASRAKAADTQNRLSAEGQEALRLADNAARNRALYQQQADLLQTLYPLAVQEWTAGNGSLENVIGIRRQLLDYQLKMAEATATHNTQLLSFLKITAQWL